MMAILQELLRQKRTILTVMLVLLVATVVIYQAGANFLEPRVSAATARYEELRRTALHEGNADSTTLYQRGIADLKTLSVRIPAKRQFPQLLGELMELASSNTLAVGTMSYKPQPVKEDDLLAYSLSMTVSGKYASVKSFLAELQTKPELVVIDHASFSNEDPYEESVSMALKMTVYLKNQGGA